MVALVMTGVAVVCCVACEAVYALKQNVSKTERVAPNLARARRAFML